MGQVGQGPAAGLPAFLEGRRRDQQGGGEAAGDEEPAHDQGGGGEQLAGVADAAPGFSGVSPGSPRTSGITATPVSKPDRPRASGEDHQGHRDHRQRAGVVGSQQVAPVGDHLGVGHDVLQGDHDHHQVEGQVDGHQGDRDPDGLGEPLEEHGAEQGDQDQRDQDRLVLDETGRIGVLQHVGGGVGRRQGDRDHEVGGHEPEQGEHEQLALHHDSSRSSMAIEPSPLGLSAATRR